VKWLVAQIYKTNKLTSCNVNCNRKLGLGPSAEVATDLAHSNREVHFGDRKSFILKIPASGTHFQKVPSSTKLAVKYRLSGGPKTDRTELNFDVKTMSK